MTELIVAPVVSEDGTVTAAAQLAGVTTLYDPGAAVASPISFAWIIDALADFAVVAVSCASGSGAVGQVAAVTVGGVAMVSKASVAVSGTNRVQIFTMVAPATGSRQVVVTFSGGAADMTAVVAAQALRGIHQSDPVRTAAMATGGTSTPTTGAFASAVLDVVVAAASAGGSMFSAGQNTVTQIWSKSSGGGFDLQQNFNGSWTPGGVSVTRSWSMSGNNPWAIAALSLRPARRTAAGVPSVGSESMLVGA